MQIDRCASIRRFGDQGCGYNVGRVNSHPDRIAGVTKTQRMKDRKVILHSAAALSYLGVDNIAATDVNLLCAGHKHLRVRLRRIVSPQNGQSRRYFGWS